MPWGSGFGSPSYVGGVRSYDSGFGHPTPTIFDVLGGNVGFGAPSRAIPTSIGAVLIIPGGKSPDCGGVVIRMLAHFWPKAPAGFRIRLLDSDGQPHPSDRDCWGVLPNKNLRCYTDGTRQLLTFCAPPCPPGDYDIRIRYAAGAELVIANALTVINRSRSEATYRMRARLPAGNYRTGPQSLSEEPAIVW